MKCSKILKTHKQKKYIYNKILKLQGIKFTYPKFQGCVLQFTLHTHTHTHTHIYIYIYIVEYKNLSKVIVRRVISMAEGNITMPRRLHPQTVRPRHWHVIRGGHTVEKEFRRKGWL